MGSFEGAVVDTGNERLIFAPRQPKHGLRAVRHLDAHAQARGILVPSHRRAAMGRVERRFGPREPPARLRSDEDAAVAGLERARPATVRCIQSATAPKA